MASLKAVIFDYYETLAELSLSRRERLFDDIARDVGLDLPPGEAYGNWRDQTVSDSKLRFDGQRPPLDGTPPPFVAFRDVWLARSEQLFKVWGVDTAPEVGAEAYAGLHANADLYPEVTFALDALRGRYRLAVLSDADRDFLAASIRRNDLKFEAVLASEDLRAYKPHVSVFRAICERLGIDPGEAVYVGDSPRQDVEGARHAGLSAVWVNRHDASWPDDVDPPPATVQSLEELPKLLAELG